MHRVVAGVAQLAERPSCKRATKGHMSCGLFERLAGFGVYSARAAQAGGRHGKAVIDQRGPAAGSQESLKISSRCHSRKSRLGWSAR